MNMQIRGNQRGRDVFWTAKTGICSAMEQLMLNHTMYLSSEKLLIKAWGYGGENRYKSCVDVYLLYLQKRLSAINSKVEII